MSSVIKFGTDGWRALTAEEFTLPNVRWVTQATADYLTSHPAAGRRKTVLVGYDTRPLGDRFAEVAAEVFAANGFKVLLTDGPVPTPAVSFSIKRLKTLAGVVITASHNPFTYNGFKFKPSYAGPAEPEMTRWIEKRLPRAKVRRISLKEGLSSGKIKHVNLIPAYFQFLRGYVEWPVIKKAKFRVAYDSMYGAGQDLLQRLTAGTKLEIIALRGNARSPRKSSHRPEPVGEHLGCLEKLVKARRCDVGLANDGDADRLGIVGPDGKFVSSQETMALLLWHLLEDRGWRGMVVTTVAGTNMMDKMAAHYRVPLKRTPVGFKHIARLIRSGNVLFGGEESGGYGLKGCVPERDGLLTGLLILEMMAMRRKPLSIILSDMRRAFGHWSYSRADLALSHPLDPKRLKGWARSVSSNGMQIPGAPPLREIQTTDGAKVVFKDRSWLLLRPSGTEPLLRIYAEARNSAAIRKLIKVGRSIGKRMVG